MNDFKVITGQKIGSDWYVVLSDGDKFKRYDGGDLLSIVRAIERDLMGEQVPVEELEFEHEPEGPDLHDLTGDPRHIGVEVPASWG